MAASELFSFLGKVEGKFAGTIGIFVSREDLTDNFISALRSGRRQSILVLHGTDIEWIFDPSFHLEDYLNSHLEKISIDNLPHYSAERFRADEIERVFTKRATTEVSAQPGAVSKLDKAFQDLVENEKPTNSVSVHLAALNENEKIEAVTRIVEEYAALITKMTFPEWWRGENLRKFLAEAIPLLPPRKTKADDCFFLSHLSKDFKSPIYGPLTPDFAPRYVHLAPSDKEWFEARLEFQWEKAKDAYDAENLLASQTKPLWSYLTDSIKNHLIQPFVEIVLSGRLPKFPQYELAIQVLSEKRDSQFVQAAFDSQVKQAVKIWRDMGAAKPETKALIVSQLIYSFQKMQPYLNDYEKRINDVVASEVINV